MMGFLSNLFGKKKEEHSITNYQDFWQWFKQEAPTFQKVIKDRPKAEYVEEHFLDKVLDKLHQLNEQFFCVAGVEDDKVALTITAEGDIKTFVFVEELVAAAPAIPGWTITALQQPTDEPIDGIKLALQGYTFNSETLSFFSNDQPDYPDEIDLVFIYKDYKKEDHNIIANGTLLYLDNVLGELKFATLIDNVTIRGAEPGDKELIPLEKLEPFLAWREKEFVEKYHSAQCNTEDNDYAVLEALDENELPLLAVVNSSLMDWEAKPSHPWMLCLEIVYKPGHAGMPGDDDHEHMQKLDEWLEAHFTDAAGTYSIVRETYNGTRTIYYACREFRQSSKLADALLKEYKNKLKVNVSIFKDKYWQSLNRFRQSPDLSGEIDME